VLPEKRRWSFWGFLIFVELTHACKRQQLFFLFSVFFSIFFLVFSVISCFSVFSSYENLKKFNKKNDAFLSIWCALAWIISLFHAKLMQKRWVWGFFLTLLWDYWCTINLGWKPGGGVVSRRIVFPVMGTLDVWKEVLRPTSSGTQEVEERTGTEPCSCSCSRSLSRSSSESPLNTSRFMLARAVESGLVKGSRLASGDATAGSATPLASGQTTSGIVECGTPSTDTLTVCTLGDRHYIYRSRYMSQDRPGHNLLPGGKKGLSSVSQRRSLSLSLQSFLCFDICFSRPEPEEPEPTKDIDRDWRQDSQILIE
jgi:hypothetical protein